MTTDINATIKAAIEAQIIATLKNMPEAINELVKAALMPLVDPSTGRADGYSSNRVPYLDYVCGETIRQAAHTAVREVVLEMAPQIKEIVRERLQAENVVDAFAKAIIKSTADDWRINVHFERDRDR